MPALRCCREVAHEDRLCSPQSSAHRVCTCARPAAGDLPYRILPYAQVQMAGASAGSLAVATYNCGLDVGAATQALHEFAADCRANGTRYRLGAWGVRGAEVLTVCLE